MDENHMNENNMNENRMEVSIIAILYINTVTFIPSPL